MKKTACLARVGRWLGAATLACGAMGSLQAATTPLADQPVVVADVPANVMLALSVEFPTAITRAHQGGSFDTTGNTKYLGYFDPEKCYDYVTDTAIGGYFKPSGVKTTTGYACVNKWSGNFMNWATMQGIDTFRWVLTGGNRVIDEPSAFAGASGSPLGRTVLQRAYASKQGSYLTSNFPDRGLNVGDVGKYTGLGTAYTSGTGPVWVRNGGMGVNTRFGKVVETTTTTGSGKNSTTTTVVTNPWTRDDNPSPAATACATTCTDFAVNVEVCHDDGTAQLESQTACGAYKDSTGTKVVYKPIGLMQRYKDKMYFGAFGYLQLGAANSVDGATSNQNKDGGVLRAKIQSIAGEITETGAFVTDPYGLRDASKAITNSGAINYLNKFGTASQGYKYYDPVSEMYAEVIKYFKKLKPTASYLPSASASSTLYDGFPVFTTWNDPATDAKYPTKGALSCKRNYVIGIGDTNTNYDRNLSGGDGPVPADVDSNMAGKTARQWTDDIGTLEGIANLGTLGISNGGYLMAGIAYYAHSSDLRSDLDGIQTVSTYWMDVMESGYVSRNQYWLTAKYGGYVKPTGTAPGPFVSGTDIWKAAGRTSGGNVLPDNYYTANSPDSMRGGLESAFLSIASGSGVSAGAALSSAQVNESSGGANTYQGTYDATFWSGDVVAKKVNGLVKVDGTVTDELNTTALWNAAAKLDALSSASRKIVTLSPVDKTVAAPTSAQLVGAAFQWANLSDRQKLNLSKSALVPAGDATDGQRILNYLRGDRSNESTSASVKLYRQRGSTLGDIVDSKVVYLGKPAAAYADSYNPGYSTFKTSNASRTPVVLVGANDGMLHGFDASETTNAGNELFALVPNSVFEGPDGTPDVSGIQALARPTYTHHYYMNATPETRDVDFARTGGKFDSFGSVAADWRTLMVVGQGKGGRSFVAMDVSSLSSSLTEAQVAGKVLWEYTHADMGFSFGRPLIAKTRRWGWVVILTGGYNNIGGTNAGKGAIFILNAKTGALLGTSPVYTTAGSADSPSGLAQIEGYTSSYQDYTLDYVYGGDLLGNLWRFDFTSSESDLPSVLKLAEFQVDGVGQPITVAPKIEYSADDLKRYVFVGTGRLLESSDLNNTSQNTMYAVRDGTRTMAYGTGSNQLPVPTGVSLPVQRSKMVAVTDLLSGASLNDSTPMGWYYDLQGKDTSVNAGNPAVTERVIVNLDANDGVLTWTGTIMNADPCSASGTARLYSVQYGSGQSVFYNLLDGLQSRTEYISVSTGLAATTLVRLGSRIRVIGTDVKGSSKFYGSTIAETGDPRVVNWRVIRE